MSNITIFFFLIITIIVDKYEGYERYRYIWYYLLCRGWLVVVADMIMTMMMFLMMRHVRLWGKGGISNKRKGWTSSHRPRPHNRLHFSVACKHKYANQRGQEREREDDTPRDDEDDHDDDGGDDALDDEKFSHLLKLISAALLFLSLSSRFTFYTL